MNPTEKIACHTIIFGSIPDIDDNKKIELTGKIGFPAIEGIQIGPDSDLNSLRDHLNNCNVKMAALGFPGLIMGLDDDELTKTAKEQVQIGQELECDTIVTMVPRTDGKKIHSFGTCTEHYEEAAKKLDLIGRIFSDNGMQLCIHNHIDHMTESTEEMDILMQETNDQYVGICFDSAHAVCAGNNPLQYAGRFKSRIRYLHVKDTENLLFGRPYFFKNNFVPLGQGVIDLKAIITLLQDHGYQGWYTFELDSSFSKGNPEEEARISLKFLEDTI